MARTAARPVGRLLMVGLVAAVLVAAVPRMSWASARTHAAQENALTATMNAERNRVGLRPLTVNLQLTRVARAWSGRMAAEAALAHNPHLGEEVAGTWTRLGENVGYSTDGAAAPDELVKRLHESFMASPDHRANVLGDFNQVGVGVSMAGDTMWVTATFSKDERVVPNDVVADAVAASQRVFGSAPSRRRPADHVVVAASDQAAQWSDAADEPVLFTHPGDVLERAPVLHPFTRAEIDRVLGGRGLVYVVGGPDRVSDEVVHELVGDGYTVQRVEAPPAA